MTRAPEPPIPLGTWTTPSGQPVVVTGRVVITLEVHDLPAPDPHPLTPDDRRWFVEEILPQLRGPLAAQLEAGITAVAVTWATPPEGS